MGNFLGQKTGVRGVCEDLADQLRRSGWQVRTTSSARMSISRGFEMVAAAARPTTEIGVTQIDLYSGRAFLWAEMVTAVMRARKMPYIITAHGGGLPEFARRRKARVGRVLRGAGAVTAPSGFLARELEYLRGDIRIIPNGLDLSAYAFRERSSVRPRLIWLRAMHRFYDPVLAVHVVSRLVDQYPSVTMSMIGPDKVDGSLGDVQQAITEAGLEGRVSIEGSIAKDMVPDRLETCDIFLNTSQVDNAPVTLIEPMACGLCVVTTDAGGVPDLVQPDHDALVGPIGDSGALARQIERLLSNPDLAGNLSRNGRVSAERHDWKTVLPIWESLFTKVASHA